MDSLPWQRVPCVHQQHKNGVRKPSPDRYTHTAEPPWFGPADRE